MKALAVCDLAEINPLILGGASCHFEMEVPHHSQKGWSHFCGVHVTVWLQLSSNWLAIMEAMLLEVVIAGLGFITCS